jgi:hypothetical protein
MMGVRSQRHAPAELFSREKQHGTRWKKVWVGPRVDLGAGVERKNLCPCRGSNHGRPVRSQDTILTELPRLYLT